MESFLSAVLGELISRSINFIINKWSKPPALSVEESLQRALLRAQVIVEEAMGRHITNQAMIKQLNMLRDALHQGYYTFDTFRYLPRYVEDGKDLTVSLSMSQSKVPSAKHRYFSGQTTQLLEQLQEMLCRLTSMIVDLNEFVVFMMNYPCLYRQPYSMYILLGSCMFGRQIEVEHVIKFLLQTQPRSYEELEILPIVGPARIGKSTLVAHVCKDERVLNYFSEIWWLDDHNLKDDDELAFTKRCAMKHQNHVSTSNKGKRRLLVVELSGNDYEDAWNRLYVASTRSFPRGSKIIFTSRSEQIFKFGTTPALTLKHLSHEAYWYFFKTLTFGSMDPEAHPRHAQLALEISKTQKRSIIDAYIISYLLRNNFDIDFWCKVLNFFRGFIRKHVSKFNVHPIDLLGQHRPVQHVRMARPSEEFKIISHQYPHSSQQEVPEMTVQDLVYGSSKKHGNFEVLSWSSQIPPYYSYVCTCEIREAKITGAKRKRSMKHRFTYC